MSDRFGVGINTHMKDKIIALVRNPNARKIVVRAIIAALAAAGIVVSYDMVDTSVVVATDVCEVAC